jgi:hypothetical protein
MTVCRFVCLTRNQAAGTIDIQDLPDARHRQHAVDLLREHASAAAVEVWRDDQVLETIDRTVAVTRSAGGELRRGAVRFFSELASATTECPKSGVAPTADYGASWPISILAFRRGDGVTGAGIQPNR